MAEGLLLTFGRTPIVTMLHSSAVLMPSPTLLGERMNLLMERLAMRRSDAVIGPSDLLVDRLVALGSLRTGEAHIVPLPVVEPAIAVGSPSSEDTRWIIQVGRLEGQKAPELTLEAVGNVVAGGSGCDIRLIYLGASNGEWAGQPYDVALQTEAKRMGVHCDVLGKVSPVAVRQWLSRAWLLAAPSRNDSGPLVALEAMAAGVPVVCSDACGVAAEIAAAGAGAVFPTGAVDAFADSLRSLLDVERRTTAGREALRLARDKHAPEIVTSQREAVYRSVQRTA